MSYDKQALVECIQCAERFSEEDIVRYKYFPTTFVCYKCYMRMWKLPLSESCFGKAYKTNAAECRLLCPDRRLCPKFQSGAMQMKHEMSERDRKAALALLYNKPTYKRNRDHPFRAGSLAHQAFELCRKGTTRSQLEKLAKQFEGDVPRLLRLFRKEQIYGFKWSWVEAGTSFRIDFAPPRKAAL